MGGFGGDLLAGVIPEPANHTKPSRPDPTHKDTPWLVLRNLRELVQLRLHRRRGPAAGLRSIPSQAVEPSLDHRPPFSQTVPLNMYITRYACKSKRLTNSPPMAYRQKLLAR